MNNDEGSRLALLHNTPYKKAYALMPSHIHHVLYTRQISWAIQDGELLHDMMLDPDTGETTQFMADFILDCEQALPAPVSQSEYQLITENIKNLLDSIRSSRSSSSMTPLECQCAMTCRSEFFKSYQPFTGVEALTKKWRHWKPGNIRHMQPTTQRTLELSLRSRWLDRLLVHFLPICAQVPHMAVLAGDLDPHIEYSHLFGDTRWRTLRVHCLTLELLMRAHKLALPWKEESLRLMLNSLLSQESTPSQVQRAWLTIKWLSGKLGLLDPDCLGRLKVKKEAIRDALVSTVTAPQKKATLPSLQIIRLLEELAVASPGDRVPGSNGRLRPVDPFICSVARFAVGSSARFSDMQHCAISTWQLTSNTTELMAWQSKTTSTLQLKQKPLPLMAPLTSFSGCAWWTTFHRYIRLFQQSDSFKQIDFLIPAVSKDGQGFIPRPCTYERAILWLREALIQGGAPAKEVQELTWHSFRLFAPDCAFQAMIPKEQRQYLGNWSSSSLPDVYTREKRHVVCSIWNQVLEALPGLKLTSVQSRVDLEHPDWNIARTPNKKARKSTASTQGDGVPDSVIVNSAAMAPDSDDEDLQVITTTSNDQVPIDEVPAPLGPLLPGVRRTKTRTGQTMHFFTQQGKAVGCGWQGLDKCDTIAHEDFMASPDSFPLCKPCSKLYSLPQSWKTETMASAGDPDSASSGISSGSLTDDEADTASEADALRPEELGDGVPR
jgi:hypothetical protein